MNQDKMFEIQTQIRQNQAEMQDYLKELETWEGDVKKKETKLKEVEKDSRVKDLPPVRNSLDRKKKKRKKAVIKKEEKENDEKENDEKEKPKRINAYDFRSWDKFDVDKACAEIDQEELGQSSSSGSDLETDEEWEVERKKQQAIYEKDKGNQYFKEKKYDIAVECYTKGIECDQSNALLPANRAMALLKQDKFAAAEKDCSHAIMLDPTYIKAYARRGAARMGLQKWTEAKSDFHKVITLEPSNKQAKQELEKIQKMLTAPPLPPEDTTGIVNAIYKPPDKRSKKPLRRIEIEELGIEDMEAKRSQDIEEVKASQSQVKHKTLEKDEQKFDEILSSANASPATIANLHMDNNTSSVDNNSAACVAAGKQTIKIQELESSDSDTIINRTSGAMSPVSKLSPVVSPVSSPRDGDASVSPRIPAPPQNAYQFQAAWATLKKYKDKFHQYLKAIPSGQYRQMIGTSLEADMLMAILNDLLEYYIPGGDDVFPVMEQLATVQRFTMTVMFLSPQEKLVIKKLLDHLKQNAQHNQASDIDALRRKYDV